MGGPVAMQSSVIGIKKGQIIDRNVFLRRLVDALYTRNDIELKRGNFRVKGDTVDIFMAYSDHILRVTWWDDEIDTIEDRKSTRLNSSHANISYAVFCLKKKTIYRSPSYA